MVALARDMARLLQFVFLRRAQVPVPVPEPQLDLLSPEAVAELRERPEWDELTAAATLPEALQQLASSGLAEQVRHAPPHALRLRLQRCCRPPVPRTQGRPAPCLYPLQLYYELFSGGSDEEDEEEQPPAAAPGQPAQASAGGQAASIEEGELVGAALSTPLPKQPRQEDGGTAEASVDGGAVAALAAGAAASDAEDAEGSSAANGAAAALTALAALAGTAWDEGDNGEAGASTSGRKRRAPRPPSTERPPRRSRAAKLWCRCPGDGSKWALVLSASALQSRQVSLPWTNPGGGRAAAACCRPGAAASFSAPACPSLACAC